MIKKLLDEGRDGVERVDILQEARELQGELEQKNLKLGKGVTRLLRR